MRAVRTFDMTTAFVDDEPAHWNGRTRSLLAVDGNINRVERPLFELVEVASRLSERIDAAVDNCVVIRDRAFEALCVETALLRQFAQGVGLFDIAQQVHQAEKSV